MHFTFKLIEVAVIVYLAGALASVMQMLIILRVMPNSKLDTTKLVLELIIGFLASWVIYDIENNS